MQSHSWTHTRQPPPQLRRTGSSRRHLPNALSIGRILITPIFGVTLIQAGDGHSWRAGALFGAAALTDQIDGWLARRWRAESRLGALVDPLADKLIIGTAMVVLMHAGRIPEVAFALVLLRQGVLWGARAYSRGRYGFPVSRMARASAWVLYASLWLIIITPPGTRWPLGLFWVGIALALAEVWPYTQVLRRHSRRPSDTVPGAADLVDQGGQLRDRRDAAWTRV
ncbi:hypothetical protein GCE86_08780 [Micromonospora terminaliae]|uniref:CDP-alcohol phosphatidyltransferase family protein n=1 Tax=Micromonospora terminaliae TaxID=1914461 RepID=A0AAJ2ZFT1_9ACTN|nr:CDP-alcohol phosphatidyltransferase family protein [Micromonospora terminaliae]NES28118.1 CDP-alcohol phosphatidyltransferase family protein [Micromonospora terminaliae]QGL47136.1 hypothetical protein GCE86_08780 [Micromonospora terminaliae]